MSGRAPYKPLVKKAIAACVAAIETYNKPASQHREETFAILVVSAWEAILKARLVRDGGLRAIYVLEPARTKSGKPGKRLRPKLNRCKNPLTISFDAALNLCAALPHMPLDKACAANLSGLVEVRDNAVHFMNADRELARRVHEAGAGALRNFASALEEWFGISLGDQRFAILPVSFEPLATATLLQPAKRSRQAANLMAFLDTTYDEAPSNNGRYVVSLRLETQLVGGRNKDAVAVRPTSDPSAPVMRFSDEDWKRLFPMDYDSLLKRLRKRIHGFKANAAFNSIMKRLKKDGRLAGERHLHPSKNSTVMWFYADAMVDAVAAELAKLAPAAPLLD